MSANPPSTAAATAGPSSAGPSAGLSNGQSGLERPANGQEQSDMDVDDAGDEAGPSSITIPSTGLEFWEYRRACFLAGAPFPSPSSGPSPSPLSPSSPSDPSAPSASSLPPTYSLPLPPRPAPDVPYRPSPTSAVGRLESLLTEFASSPTPSSASTPSHSRTSSTSSGRPDGPAIAWNGGVGNVHRNLTGSKRLARGLRLGLVIRILRAGWVRDGTWPMDPRSGRPVDPPSSPELVPATMELDELEGEGEDEESEEEVYPPIHEGRIPRPIDRETIRGPIVPTVADAVSSTNWEVVEKPPVPKAKEQPSFGSRLAALIPSSLMSGGNSSGSGSGSGTASGYCAGSASAVTRTPTGVDSPLPRRSQISDAGASPTKRQVRPPRSASMRLKERV